MNQSNDTASPEQASDRGGIAPGGGRLIQAAVFVGMVALLAWVVLALLGRQDRTRAIELGDVIAPGAAAGYNVLLITMDTTRADRLGCYGYGPTDTPVIDSLLDYGVRFDDAVATAPITLVSHASILTGRYPYHHGVRDNGTFKLADDQVTLAEAFKEKGYATAAFVGTFVLDERFGLSQGFDVYDFEVSATGWRDLTSTANEREADKVVHSAINWLTRRPSDGDDKPFFMWVHFYDPHSPYESPLFAKYAAEREPSIDVAYDAEIAFVDQQLGQLFAQLDRSGRLERTLVVLTADHGEMLGEHGEAEHGGFIYESAVHAPLIISCRSLIDRPYRVDDRVVSTVDIAPTILELVGAGPLSPADGVGLATAPLEAERAVYTETFHTKFHLGCAPLLCLRRHHDKFILAPRPEYYDLRNDAAEASNLYGGVLFEGRDLEENLLALIRDTAGPESESRTMSPDEVARLAALGYVDFAGGAADQQVDPKDRVPQLSELGQALVLKRQGELEQALEVSLDVADRLDGVFAPVKAAAGILVELGRRDEAIRLLSDHCVKYPTIEAAIALAAEQLAAGRYEDLERTLETAELIEPGSGAAPMIRGNRYFQEGRYAEAVEAYRHALEIDRERVQPLVQDRLQEAVRRLQAQKP